MAKQIVEQPICDYRLKEYAESRCQPSTLGVYNIIQIKEEFLSLTKIIFYGGDDLELT